MASFFPPKKNTAFVLYIAVASQANTKIMQSSPTIASGDFKVSIDGGALNNLATLPVVTPAASKMIKVDLSAGEMNGDNITLVCSDAAGAEWCDLVVNLQTTARQIDDLAYPTTSGRSIDVATTGEVGLDFDNIKDAAGAHTLTNITVPLVTTVTNLTNAPTAGDLTATMKTSVTTAATAATPIAASVSGNVGGNVAGSVGSVAAGGITQASFAANALDSVWSVASRLLTAGTNIVLAKGVGVTGFNDVSAAQVNAEVVDVLTVDTYAEPSGAPAATSSLKDKIGWPFKLARNLRKTTAATDSVYNDAGNVVDSTSTISDDGTTFTRGEYT